ncbi:hypothetical protein EU527_16415 [Candidatus Thorarchaeota archaeon]|nr:MAG: hypothetical protein EU527_16415 [Candidatus Thorarchaeota archaeon]
MKRWSQAVFISSILLCSIAVCSVNAPLNYQSVIIFLSFTYADEIAPTIILVNPENESIVKPFSWIDIEIEDDVAISQVLYHWDDIANETFEPPYDLMARTSEVAHTLYVYANDTSNNWAAAVFVFISDSTIPEISLNTPINDSIYLSGEIINVTVTDKYLDSVLYSWDFESNVTWNQPYSTPLISGDGEHSFLVYANDTAGNWAKQQFIFITDDLQPNIDLESPINGSIKQSGTEVIVRVQDASLDMILYAWDQSSSNITTDQSPISTQIPSGETFHILTVHANDSLGRWASTIFIFEVDDTSPTIEISSPSNGSLVHSGAMVTIIVNDTSGTVVLFYNWNGEGNESLLTPIPIGDGLQVLEVYAYDLADNLNYARFVFEVDDSPPVLNHPEDIVVDLNQEDVNITWLPIDGHPSQYSIYQNGTLIDSDYWSSGAIIILYIDTTFLGWSNYTIVIIDTLGNLASDSVMVHVVEPEVSESEPSREIIMIAIITWSIVISIGIISFIVRKKNIRFKKTS